MVGAVLTQNTAWSNVARAISNLKADGRLAPEAIVNLSDAELAEMIRSAGYFNVKARRLKNFCQWYLDQGGYDVLSRRPTPDLRKQLLSVNGIGPETADDMLLYAFSRPVFVVDAYTRRLFSRLGNVNGNEDYEELRGMFEKKIGADVPLYNEYHALIVHHAKEIRHAKKPARLDDRPHQGQPVEDDLQTDHETHKRRIAQKKTRREQRRKR